MEKTAVDWLIKELESYGDSIHLKMEWEAFDELINQAKEMEKEQIENAYNQGASDAFDNDYSDNFLKFNDSEDYYNKMYNQLNNK